MERERKPHQCSICGRRFHTTEGLQDHTRLRHRGEYHDPAAGYTLPGEKIVVGAPDDEGGDNGA